MNPSGKGRDAVPDFLLISQLPVYRLLASSTDTARSVSVLIHNVQAGLNFISYCHRACLDFRSICIANYRPSCYEA